MSQTRTVGWVLLLGAVLLFVTEIATAFLFPGNDPVNEALNPLYVPTNVVAAVGSLLLLWALPLVATRGVSGIGRLGSVGALLIFVVGAGFGIFVSTLSAVIYPYLAQHAPAVLKAELPGFDLFLLLVLLAWLLGATLLGIALLRSSAAGTRVPGCLLLASAVMTVVGVGIHSVGTQSLWLNVFADLNSFLLFVALGWLGWLLTGRDSKAVASAGEREHGHLTAVQPSTES
jgi:hypothetical protein